MEGRAKIVKRQNKQSRKMERACECI